MGGPESWVGGSSGNHQGGANSVSQVRAVSDISCLPDLMREGSEKEQWPLSALLSGRKLSPAVALVPDTSVSSHMPLVPFKLQRQCWSSEGGSLWKFACRPLRRNCLGIPKFLSSTASVPAGFLSQEVMGTYLPGTGTLGSDPWLLRFPSRIFNWHTWVWDQPVPHLCPLFPISMWFLF